MRPWLVATGAAFLLVGVGAVVGLQLFSSPPVEQQSSEQLVNDVTPPNGLAMFTVTGTAHSDATFTLRWTSTAPIAVELNAGNCSALAVGCDEPVLHNWSSARSGTFTIDGTIDADYVLAWTTAPSVVATVNSTAVAQWYVATHATLTDLIAEVASGLLAGVGAVAVFLGLFLRGGYRGPPRIVSRTADDAAGVAELTDPRTATSDGGSEPPRRGPPARSA
jgi:hypothetical protein